MKIYTENNWISSNINDREQNPLEDFKVILRPYPFINLTFYDECNLVAKKIKDKYADVPLFLGLSGGADSEFVFKIFIKNNISFTPVIVLFKGNEIESKYAFTLCEDNNISPVILYLDNKQLLKIIYYDIVKRFNGIGKFAAANIAIDRYVKDMKGILILAEHVVGDGAEMIDNYIYHFSEYDFYVDNIPFFCYTTNIMYSMLQSVDASYVNWMTYKHKVFEVALRPKIRPVYSDTINDILRVVYKHKKEVKSKHYLGDKCSLMNFLTNV